MLTMQSKTTLEAITELTNIPHPKLHDNYYTQKELEF